MASKFCRVITGVRDVNKLSLNTNEEGDIIVQTNGEVFVREKQKYDIINASSGGEGGITRVVGDSYINATISEDGTTLTLKYNDEQIQNINETVTNLEVNKEEKLTFSNGFNRQANEINLNFGVVQGTLEAVQGIHIDENNRIMLTQGIIDSISSKQDMLTPDSTIKLNQDTGSIGVSDNVTGSIETKQPKLIEGVGIEINKDTNVISISSLWENELKESLNNIYFNLSMWWELVTPTMIRGFILGDQRDSGITVGGTMADEKIINVSYDTTLDRTIYTVQKFTENQTLYFRDKDNNWFPKTFNTDLALLLQGGTT